MQTQTNLESVEAEFTTTLVPGSIKGAMQAGGFGSRDLWQVEPSAIQVIEGLNPRVMNESYKAHIRNIADSIISNGYYQDQPLAGYIRKINGEQIISIYSGHTRLLAVNLAISEGKEIKRIPVTISMEGLSLEDITVALIRGNDGKTLTYFETAIVCKRLIGYGFTRAEITRRTGITEPQLKSRMTLLAAPLKIREFVANEKISASLAIEMITKHGEKALEKIEESLTAATTIGKTRVTKSQTEVGLFERAKFVKKSAPKLYEAAGAVRDDPGYAALSVETRELIEGLLAEIKSKGTDATPEAVTDPRQQTIEDTTK